MSRHAERHPLAGQTVKLAAGVVAPDLDPGDEFRVEDYWDRVSGQSWGDSQGNPAAMKYAIRTGLAHAVGGREVPLDDEVLYGKVRGVGHLVHVSEIEGPGVTGEAAPPGPCPECGARGASQRWDGDADDATCGDCGTSYWMTTVDPS